MTNWTPSTGKLWIYLLQFSAKEWKGDLLHRLNGFLTWRSIINPPFREDMPAYTVFHVWCIASWPMYGVYVVVTDVMIRTHTFRQRRYHYRTTVGQDIQNLWGSLVSNVPQNRFIKFTIACISWLHYPEEQEQGASSKVQFKPPSRLSFLISRGDTPVRGYSWYKCTSSRSLVVKSDTNILREWRVDELEGGTRGNPRRLSASVGHS